MTVNHNRGCSWPCGLTCMHKLLCTWLLLAKELLLAVATGKLGVPAAMWSCLQHGWTGHLLGQVPCIYPAIYMLRRHAEHLPVPLLSLEIELGVPC